MQLLMRGLCAGTLDVDPLDTLEAVCARLEAVHRLPVRHLRLSHAGRPLRARQTLAARGVRAGDALHVAARLRGGHCQVPCGIFDDARLIAEFRETVATVRKAMAQIRALADASGALERQQLVRWVLAKEAQCEVLVRRLSDYCLCQRVKPGVFSSAADYGAALGAHHAALLAAVRAKQSVDDADADALEHALDDVARMYAAEAGAAGAGAAGAARSRL
jgi:hypothetical protein